MDDQWPRRKDPPLTPTRWTKAFVEFLRAHPGEWYLVEPPGEPGKLYRTSIKPSGKVWQGCEFAHEHKGDGNYERYARWAGGT